MIFDTDIFIWVQRGNEKAARHMEKSVNRFLSIQSYVELFQCVETKTQHKYVKDFIASYGFIVLPFTENIGHRASIYIEEYTLSSGLRSGDAIIAATAVENNMPLFSSNTKHFRMIKELKFKVFKP
ncbi:MAG: type II toxin-antitoxin system VapC family toxin [Deltaproteobacteria bacterium]|nr:MAG: type II toxin-antitoxin system VapC family toxin [Deltaproteobacteria bacterium]